MSRQHWIFGISLIVLVAIMLYVPNQASRYQIVLLYTLLANIAMAQSWNLVGGYTGLISLGHSAFFGIGAYTAGIGMSQLDLPFWYAVTLGAMLALIASILISFPIFRFKGVYFAIGTLVLAEALRIWMINWEWTGGAQGMRFPLRGLPGREELYYIMLGIVVVITLVIYWITNSRLGLGLRAIRDNEQSAQNMGVNIFRTKLIAFAISAFATGFIGAVHAVRLGTIEPYSIFALTWTIAMVNMVIIGGMGTLLGPIIGAIFVTYLGEALADFYSFHLIITGIIFILVIRFMPGGIFGTFLDLTKLARERLLSLKEAANERAV